MSLNKREHDLWYQFLVIKKTEVCENCKRTPKAKPGSPHYVPRLLIHEKQYKRPIQLDLICFLCDSCNQLVHPTKPERFRREAPPELKVNRIKEPIAREYMINRILLDGKEDMNTLLASTAEKAGCSIKTCESYLDKLTSDEGMLIEILGTIYLRGYEPKLKFDIMSTRWIEDEPAKQIPNELIKSIQENLHIR